jgi:integrase
MLSEDVNRYVEHHRALGFKYRIQDRLLRNFAAFAEAQGDEAVRTQRALDWAGQAPSPQQRRNRLLTVRRFARAMQAEDARYQVPPTNAFGRVAFKRRTPHIYTAKEIMALLKAAARLTPEGSIRPATYTTLFALLAATGLRSSEALALTLEDVTDDGLLIRETKFRKSRLVPLHETVQRRLDEYLIRRTQVGTSSPAVFVSQQGTALSYSTVVTVFLSLIRAIGLRAGPGQPGPCLHDLRHTFAVRSLEQCGTDPDNVKRHMLALSTYLGHAHVSDTYWYLQATPKLMTQIAEAGENLHQGPQL